MRIFLLFLLSLTVVITASAQLPQPEEAPALPSPSLCEEAMTFSEEKKQEGIEKAFIIEEAPFLGLPAAKEEIKDEGHFFPQDESPAMLNLESVSSDIKPAFAIKVDLKRAFAGSPLIYLALLGMSLFSVAIWLYSFLLLKRSARFPNSLRDTLQSHLNGNHFDEALSLCNGQGALLCKMVASGIQSRKYGLSVISESMKAQGKRSSMAFWQKIGLLNDIAILAPMLGLLGTVLGMFYAFYDVNRSIESISSLFDGLGVSVGTTVAGLLVAILALILHSTAKYRLVKVLAQVEGEAHQVASLIDNHASFYANPSR